MPILQFKLKNGVMDVTNLDLFPLLCLCPNILYDQSGLTESIVGRLHANASPWVWFDKNYCCQERRAWIGTGQKTLEGDGQVTI